MSFKLPPLQTVTQCASLVTATRAVWELSRMVRQKKREVDQTKEVEDLLDEIEEFVHEGVLTKREWKAFCHNVEEAIAKKECTPREAQAKVLDFLEALHSIAQEYQDSEDGVYLSEPEEVDDVPKAHRHRVEGQEHRRIEPKAQPRRDSAINARRESQSRSHAPADQPSPRLSRSQTVPLSDPRPRRASAPQAPHHYYVRSPVGQMIPGTATPRGGSVASVPHAPVNLPSQFQNSQLYRQPRHSFASPSATPGANGAFSPGTSTGVFSPGHMLPSQPTYYPNAPHSFFTPGTASPFAAGMGGAASPAYAYAGEGAPAGPASPAFYANGNVSPPHPNYSGPLPVPPSRSFSQQSWGPLPTQVPVGPASPASTMPAQNTWPPNTTFPFPTFSANPAGNNGDGNNSNANSNRPSAAPSPPHSRSSPANNVTANTPGRASPGKPPSNPASSPIAPPSPDGSMSGHVNGWNSRNGSPAGFMSPTQEAQAQRAAAAKLREQARRQSQEQAISEELGVPDLDIPPPPNAPQHQQKPSVNWASGIDDREVRNGNGGNPPPESVSEAGTYMEPAGDKNKRRRRKQ
ncbi:hypothetical protein MPH_05848 [Macrophomina phaseolina MS6]|uniref:Uncharacterized protein n=1 Tax=Macrophomina phaseolina (strain MS6) TaxID=1126212 RepID=K2RVW2_MACPH|nr:hypothetical protein MPH_05848 [Macrophomina phaseolina MS6]